jgi:uncharacterized protein (TIGR02118 family)
MFDVTVLYHHPIDPEAFRAYYASYHIPLAKKMPGLRAYSVSEGVVATLDGSPPPYFLIARLQFDSRKAFNEAATSEVGQAVVADVPKFATGGVTMLVSDSILV